MIFPQLKITQSSFLLGVHESQALDQEAISSFCCFALIWKNKNKKN